MVGHRGLSGGSVWGPAVSRVSSGRSAAQTTPPNMEMGEHVEVSTGKHVGMSPPPHATINHCFLYANCTLPRIY